MKLRLQQGSLRLRLDGDEVAEFGRTGRVEEDLQFPGGMRFTYALLADPDATGVTARVLPDRIEVTAPQSAAQNWVSGSEIALSGPRDPDGSLAIVIEKDLGCKHRDE